MFIDCLYNIDTISVNNFKCYVKDEIRKYENLQHILTLSMYRRSDMYGNVLIQPYVWPCYTHASFYPELGKKCQILMKLVIGYDEIRNSYNKHGVCLCNGMSINYLCHILFECNLLCDVRSSQFSCLKTVLPPRLYDEFCEMSSTEKTSFILNAFNCKYVREMSVAYTAFLDYVCHIYKHYVETVIKMNAS